MLQPPTRDDEWCAITGEPLPVAAVYDWAVRPDCGAVVLFSGTARDHADGREGVVRLDYEAHETAAVERFASIVAVARRRWPSIGRVALLHRVGALELGESAVVAAVSAPHRAEAFEAARFAIDALKETAPIWKHETWRDGADWGTGAVDIADVDALGAEARSAE